MFFSRLFFVFLYFSFSTLSANQQVVLFNDTSAWYHWGCTGTSLALKEEIEALGFSLKTFPINLTYALNDVPDFDDFNDIDKFIRFSEKNVDVIKAIEDSLAVVITGEGTIHDLREGPRALLYLAHISKKMLGKHVEIINHSAYPKDDSELSTYFLQNFDVEKDKVKWELEKAKNIYYAIYSEMDFVAIRETISREEMKKINISSTLSFDCLPLYIRNHFRTPKQKNQRTLVVAGSVAFSEEGALNLCHYLEEMEKNKFQIKILIGAAAFPSKDDLLFVDFLKKNSQASWQLVNATSMEEWLDTINQATLLVSGRFHHSIAAFCLNTPFISLNSNTYKVHSICLMMKQPPPLLFSNPKLLENLLSRTQLILELPNVDNLLLMNELCGLAKKNFEGLKTLN